MEKLKSLGFTSQMVIMLVGMAVIAGVGYKFFPNLEAQKREITKRRGELEELETIVERGRQVEKKLPQLEADIARLELQLADLKTIIPEVRGDAQLIRKLSELAQRSRLSISKIEPLRYVQKDFYSEYPISLDVQASYHDLGLFFARLANFGRIFNVSSVSMRQQLSASTSLAANFKAVTFIYREEGAAPPEPAGKGKKRKRS